MTVKKNKPSGHDVMHNERPNSTSTIGIGIGIIGCGARSRHIASLTLAQSDRLKIVGLCDPSDESIHACKKQFNTPDARIYDDYQALCDDSDIQWVIIGSWNAHHAQHAIAAMKSGKNVFCEKPLATTLEDCLAIRDTLNGIGCVFSFGLVLRYAALYQRVKQLMTDGTIGKLISFEFNETLEFNHAGYIHQDWRRLTKNAGTHLLEKCCHDIDIANWLVGSRAKRVASFGGLDFFKPENEHHIERIGPNQEDKPAYGAWPNAKMSPFTCDKDIIDNQVAIIEYDNGVRATFHTNCNAGITERRLYLIGTEGAIRADLLTGCVEVKRIGWDEPTVFYRGAGDGHGNGDPVMAKHLARTMLEGAIPLATLSDGIHAAITCFGIDDAMSSGCVVDMQPYWKRI